MRDFSFSIASNLDCPQAELWRYVTQMKNVNAELMPLVRMTYPQQMSEIGHRGVPLRQPLFTSVVLLFGFVPIDLHKLCFDRIAYGHAFYENSTTTTHRYWKHTRTLTADGAKTLLQDELHFSPRIPALGALYLPIVKFVFRHRHKKLQRFFAQ